MYAPVSGCWASIFPISHCLECYWSLIGIIILYKRVFSSRYLPEPLRVNFNCCGSEKNKLYKSVVQGKRTNEFRE